MSKGISVPAMWRSRGAMPVKVAVPKAVGESTMITGGAEITPKVTVKKFEMPASLHNGDDTLLIEQSGQAVHLSPDTMQAILDWYYGR